MVPFIFVISLIVFVMLIFALYFKIYFLAAISGLAISFLSIEMLIRGIQGINSILTLTMAWIYFGVGIFIFIGSTAEEAKSYM